ncbi:MAG: enoyl-CoA hydratase/isomerase family protein [Eubacterium sp.]|nr:enoyl-CoA hydratase/isomerase family protein [Eubacterium sp.]
MSEAQIVKTRYDSHPAALYLTISNVDAANSFTQEMFRQLIDYIKEANEDPSVRVIVLRGDGDRFFSSGLSMEMLDNIKTTDDKMMQWKLGKWAREAMAASNKIIVSAVKGACAGAGFELSLMADLIYASDKAKFVLPEFNIGLIPGCGGALNLHKKIPYNRFFEMIMFCERMKPEEGLKWGIINKVFPVDEFDAQVEELVKKLCERPPLSVKGFKELLRVQSTMGEEAAYRKEYDLSVDLMCTEDFKNAVKAFRAKESPVFQGK